MNFSIFAILVSILGIVCALPTEESSAIHFCKAHKVKGRVCGAHGEVTTPKFLKLDRPFELLTTFQECRDLCLGNKRCKSFLYNRPQLQCVPYYTHIEPTNHPLFFKLAPGLLYDRECFECK